MTREELAKKKGINLTKKRSNPAETLITLPESISQKDSEKKEEESTVASVISSEPVNLEQKSVKRNTSKNAKPELKSKNGPGKPRKRKPGDRQISFWLDEDLVPGLFGTLSYGDTVGNHINDIIRQYQQENHLYKK